MARNELAELIAGLFALFIFSLMGGAVISSLAQTNKSLEGVISFLFAFSIIAIIISLIAIIWKMFNSVLGEFLRW